MINKENSLVEFFLTLFSQIFLRLPKGRFGKQAFALPKEVHGLQHQRYYLKKTNVCEGLFLNADG